MPQKPSLPSSDGVLFQPCTHGYEHKHNCKGCYFGANTLGRAVIDAQIPPYPQHNHWFSMPLILVYYWFGRAFYRLQMRRTCDFCMNLSFSIDRGRCFWVGCNSVIDDSDTCPMMLLYQRVFEAANGYKATITRKAGWYSVYFDSCPITTKYRKSEFVPMLQTLLRRAEQKQKKADITAISN